MAKRKKASPDNAPGGEGRVHKPRVNCPHLAAEFFENGQPDLGDEMLRGLLPRAIQPAQMAGRRGRFHNEPIRTPRDLIMNRKVA